MLGYLAKRLTATVPVILTVAVCVFAFVHVLPGDPARLVAGVDASLEDVQAVRESLGLDRPLPEQFVRYVGRVAHGDFGVSLKTRRTVVEEIGERLMPTVWLTVFAMAWSTVIGLLLGVISAVKRGQWQDYLGMVVAVSGISFPPFWLGLLLISVFSVRLGWFPTGIEAPRHVVPTGAVALSEVIVRSGAHLREVDDAIARIVERFGRGPVLDHPILGPFTAADWVRFHHVHTRHHCRQITDRRTKLDRCR